MENGRICFDGPWESVTVEVSQREWINAGAWGCSAFARQRVLDSGASEALAIFTEYAEDNNWLCHFAAIFPPRIEGDTPPDAITEIGRELSTVTSGVNNERDPGPETHPRIEGGDAPSTPLGKVTEKREATSDEGATSAPSEAPETAATWLGLLESGALYCRHKSFSDEDYERTAERMAHLAYAWNHDPEHVAEIWGQDGTDVLLANAAVATLQARDATAAAPSEGKLDDHLIARLKEANRKVSSACIAVVSNEPYPDDPRWTPWTRFIHPALTRLDAAVREAATALSEARTREDRIRERLDRLEREVPKHILETGPTDQTRWFWLENKMLTFWDDLIALLSDPADPKETPMVKVIHRTVEEGLRESIRTLVRIAKSRDALPTEFDYFLSDPSLEPKETPDAKA
jgi:hypothetical protein